MKAVAAPAEAPAEGPTMSPALDSVEASAAWSLYFIRNKLGHLYTGVTNDVPRRFQQHQRGLGAKALKGKGPLTLVNFIEVGTRSHACQLEYRFKQLKKPKKELLASQSSALQDWLELQSAQLKA